MLGCTTSAGASVGGPVGLVVGLAFGACVYASSKRSDATVFCCEEAPPCGCTVKVVSKIVSDGSKWIRVGCVGTVEEVTDVQDVLIRFDHDGPQTWVHSIDLDKLKVIDSKASMKAPEAALRQKSSKPAATMPADRPRARSPRSAIRTLSQPRWSGWVNTPSPMSRQNHLDTIEWPSLAQPSEKTGGNSRLCRRS